MVNRSKRNQEYRDWELAKVLKRFGTHWGTIGLNKLKGFFIATSQSQILINYNFISKHLLGYV